MRRHPMWDRLVPPAGTLREIDHEGHQVHGLQTAQEPAARRVLPAADPPASQGLSQLAMAPDEELRAYFRIGGRPVHYWVDDAGFHGRIEGTSIRATAADMEAAYARLVELFAQRKAAGGEAA